MREALTEGAKIDKCSDSIKKNETRINDVLRHGNELVGLLVYFSRRNLQELISVIRHW